MRFEDMISGLPTDRPLALLLRHAERASIDTIEDSYRALLTPAGMTAARLLGGRLAHLRPIRLAHSPVGRCRQTAACLAEGIQAAGGEATLLGERTELGGPYMLDFRAAMAAVLDEGGGRFVRAWFDGRPPADGLVRPFREAARGQLEALLASLREPGARGVWLGISHDWNLLLLREGYLGLRHEAAGWPDYLEGLAAWLDDGRLVLCRGERLVRLALPLS
ncbi:MAG TPA: histidine phosphatase family protein [Myxococcota bacterium]|nr:histidine phosphatase family protein [Myxococcota bacterium]HSA22871.1 histidine phosphatase family protein [Myxococcota bacterium]